MPPVVREQRKTMSLDRPIPALPFSEYTLEYRFLSTLYLRYATWREVCPASKNFFANSSATFGS